MRLLLRLWGSGKMTSYATNEEFSERSGLGLRVIDENVATGDETETSFDLKNDNIITGTYVLSYAASGSNDFTSLTDVTHYALDKESGRVLLTTSGKTALAKNVLYASYWYTDVFSDNVITDLLSVATSEVDKLTGKSWSGSNNKIEYFDGRRNPTVYYPTTDRPFMSDYDKPDQFITSYYPIIKVSNLFFLNAQQDISSFFNYDNGTSTFTDYTSNVNDTTGDLITLFNAIPVAGDIVYIGSNSMFLGLRVDLSTLGTGSPVIDWEYYNGTGWTDLTETETDTGSSTFSGNGEFTWSFPYGWEKNSVNSESYYWVRGKIGTAYTVAPVCASLTILDSVCSVLEPRQVSFRSMGEINILGTRVRDGVENVRVDYVYGMGTTPSYITELTILLASVKAYVNLSGGSYDAYTSATLGSKSYTVGEQYVNIREVLTQFKSRIDEILKMVGRRAFVTSL